MVKFVRNNLRKEWLGKTNQLWQMTKGLENKKVLKNICSSFFIVDFEFKIKEKDIEYKIRNSLHFTFHCIQVKE